jgi:hypothetical protein
MMSTVLLETCRGLQYKRFIQRNCASSWSFTQSSWTLSSGSRTVPYGQTGRQTDLTKLIVALRNSVNAPTDQVRCLSSYSSKETYSAKCPSIWSNMNKLSCEVTDHDIYIRLYAYDTEERWSRPVPQGNLIDQQEAEIQMWILFCQRTILISNFVMTLNNNNRSSQIQRRVLE